MILSSAALAQDNEPVPFYYALGTIYTPQVQTLIVGVNEDALGQAIVSGDKKYVTLNMDTSLLSSPGVRDFKYHKSEQGFVGDATAKATPPANPENFASSIVASPSEIGQTVSILDRPGMVLIAPLGN